MATAMVYRGNGTWVKDPYLCKEHYVYLYKGQLLFWTGNSWWDPEFNAYRHEFIVYDYGSGWKTIMLYFNTSGLPDNQSLSFHCASGSLHALGKFNCRFYGMCHSKSGGPYYSLRESQTKFVEFDNKGNIIQYGYLGSGYKVIIGGSQGYTKFDSYPYLNYVRMWGYIRSDGAVVETFNKYVCVQHITEMPYDYSINTY